MLGDPGRLQWDLNRYLNATTADVLRYAKDYINLDRRVILHVVAQSGLTAISDMDLARGTQPSGGPEPKFTPPAIQTGKLSNGIQIFLIEDKTLPLVQLNVVLKSGWASDPTNRPGAASLTAELLDEGSKTRTALQIAQEAKALCAILITDSTFDSSLVELNILKKNLDRGLDLMADVLLNPTFPQEELERQRQIYLGMIQQEAKEPNIAARKAFLRVLYGPEHPYGQPFTGTGTPVSIKAIQREDLVNFYQANYFPNNAAVAIAGDITMNEAKAKLEIAFANWKPGEVKRQEIPTPASIAKTKVYLIDKQGAPQSVVYVGNLGIRRNDPDYAAVAVLNRAFGGKFTSRLNLNLREDKGYSYGARSLFLDTRGIGPFLAYAPVQSQSTKESVVEMVKELRDLVGSRPLSAEELADAKDNIIKGYPQQFQTLGGLADRLSEIFTYQLPIDEWTRFIKEVQSVTVADTTRAAKAHIHPDALLIVISGDREKIEPKLRELNLGDIQTINPETL